MMRAMSGKRRVMAAEGWKLTILRMIAGAVGVAIVGLVAWEIYVTASDVVNGTGMASGRIESVRVEHSRDRSTSAARIAYVYRVEGIEYRGERIFPGWLANQGTSTGGGAIAQRFSAGEQTVIYYDPDRPTRAFLVPELHPSFVSLSMIILGLVLMVVMMTSRRAGPKLLRNLGWALAFTLLWTPLWRLFIRPMPIPIAEIGAHVRWFAGLVLVLAVVFTILRRFEVTDETDAAT